MMALKLLNETVETRIMNDLDILIIDYRNKQVTAMQLQELEDISAKTEVYDYDILACLQDHEGLEDYEDIYVINGYTFIYVKDFLRTPLRKVTSSSVDSSIKLYQFYAYDSISRPNPTEVLDLNTGEIRLYYNHYLALKAINSTTYDILKIPLYPDRTITEYEQYIFLAIDSYILKFQSNNIPWGEYITYALEDYEAIELLNDDDLEYK